jgi:hypothetical protein
VAATQYVEPAALARFRRGVPPPPARVETGEHGFRFFPAYYLHIWDTLRRIPLYDDAGNPTARSVYDNVQRVIAQAGTAPKGQPSLVIPREAPRSISELLSSFQEMWQLGYTPSDLSTFFGRIMRYLVTSSRRRDDEYEEISTYEYLVGYDLETKAENFRYSPSFREQIFNMPRVLAAFDARYGDARTNMNTYIQLNMALDRYDSKADGVLNGPTTAAWFDPWYRHLRALGVEFVHGTLQTFRYENGRLVAYLTGADDVDPADLEPEQLVDPPNGPGMRLPEFTYYVVATDAFRAELATAALRRWIYVQHPEWETTLADTAPATANERLRLRTLSTVLGLYGFATIPPPPRGPHAKRATTSNVRRNPLHLDSLGRDPWDRFQTLSGIQFFFETEFQILNGHVYYSNSPWALSSINSTGLWVNKPRVDREGYVSIMSVDIGDWNTESPNFQDLPPKAARDCTFAELAQEVWRQVSNEISASLSETDATYQLPKPRWYSLDQFIGWRQFTNPQGRPDSRRVNRAPYLVPIVSDWKNRPGAYPWNPIGDSPTWVPDTRTQDTETEALQRAMHVWQAGHGGYEINFDQLVFAGTWRKTFTRMTSMEAACESGRHAVNAILDHYLYSAECADDRGSDPLSWRMPFGFVDQELSIPIRFPTPAGDYCFVYDCENREPSDARPTRLLDAEYFMQGFPHPWTMSGLDQAAALTAGVGSYGAPTNIYDPGWMIEQLRQWRQIVDNVYGRAPAPAAPAPDPKAAERRSPRNAGFRCRSAVFPDGEGVKPRWSVARPTYGVGDTHRVRDTREE